MSKSMLSAGQLAPLLNSYTVSHGPPRTIIVPKASSLAGLEDITVGGTLLRKQFVVLDPKTGKRTAALAAGGGRYMTQSADGDLHFCLGAKQLQPHIACELQNAKAWLATFNQGIGTGIVVSGFFRCLFEHPGFNPKDDAHIFEVHPVRAVSLSGRLHAFNVDIPEQKSIHTWTAPHPLNAQDARIKVHYDKAKDTLTFSDMDGQDENYVRVQGSVSQIRLNASGGAPASFIFASPNIGHPLRAYCLQGTAAARQLRQLAKPEITMIALRNIDLAQALKNRYVISLLVIDITAL